MKKAFSIAIIVLGALFATGFGFYLWKFPHGRSHCCIQIVASALREYAGDHKGKFPYGESSAEASLSLLYSEKLLDAYLLRGMTVPEKQVRKILESGALLGPTTCGWNYVSGLTKADNPEIAMLWCKQALGHNGDRNSSNGRQVVFVNGDVRWISGTQWESFLKGQKELLESRTERERKGLPIVTMRVEMPDGTVVTKSDSTCNWEIKSETLNIGVSGEKFDLSRIALYRAPIDSGEVNLHLMLEGFHAEGKVTFLSGEPDRTNVVLKLGN